MSEEEPQPIQYPGLNEAVAAAVAQALANAGALQPVAQAPEGPALFMTSTPILGLRKPDIDDPALVSDLNFNMDILDGSITATGAATLTNKTLTSPVITNPTITGWTNAQHNHLNPAGAGLLDGAAIGSGYLGTGNLLRETALTDGSFSGLLLTGPTLLDPIVRTTLWWGPTGTGTPDASLARLAANSLALFGDISLTRIAPANLRVSGGVAPTIGMRSTNAGVTTSSKLLTTGDSAMLGWNLRLDAAGAVWMREDITKKSALLVQDTSKALVLYGTDKGPTPSLPDDPIAWRAYWSTNYDGTTRFEPLPEFPGVEVYAVRSWVRAQAAGATTWARFGMEYAGAGAVLSDNIATKTGAGGIGWLRDDPTKGAMAVSVNQHGLSIQVVRPGGAEPAANWASRMYIDNSGKMFISGDNGTLPSGGHQVTVQRSPADWQAFRLGGGIAYDMAFYRKPNIDQAYIGASNDGINFNDMYTFYPLGMMYIGDQTGGGAPAQQRYIRLAYNSSSGSGSPVTVIEFATPNPGLMGIDAHVPNVAKYGVIHYSNPSGVMIGLDIGWGSPLTQTAAATRLSAVGGNYIDIARQGSNCEIHTNATLQFHSDTGYNYCRIDANQHWGHPSFRWATIYCANGTIQTSLYEAKEGFAPLDPAACAEAVLGTDWVAFRYKPPAYVEPDDPYKHHPSLGDPKTGKAAGAEGEEEAVALEVDKRRTEREAQLVASKVQYAQMLDETAPSRSQKGYVLQSPEHKVHDLFGLEDRRSATPQSDLAVVACALQHALLRIEALEVQVAGAA